MGIIGLEITGRQPFAGGQAFGDAGAYELLTGRAHGAVDPHAPEQGPIADIALAPTDAEGRVRYGTDICILKPVELPLGNRRIFFDWGNRGNKRCLQYFNDAVPANMPLTAAHAGNGYLMRRGYSIVWGAWQADLLPGNGRMLLDVPVAMQDGRPVTGPVRVEFIGQPDTNCFPLSGWVSTRSHPAVSLDTRQAVLTKRRYPWNPRIPIPPEAWHFARYEGGQGLETFGGDHALLPSREYIHLPEGFQPGWIYELIYTGEAPLVLGLGHAAVRDVVSWLRHDRSTANPMFDVAAPVEKAYGYGRSQTGRAMRDFLHKGFNGDEQGRRVLDGMIIHVAGAGKLSIGRFANLTATAGQQYEDHFASADRFPFSYAGCTDHLTGRTDAILKRPATDPLVMHSQSATEYWQRRGSLVHTDTRGNDLPQPEGVRIYHWCSSQHAADPLLKTVPRGVCQNDHNVVWTSMLFRAQLDALDAWATHGTPPPPSAMPRRADGTAVTMAEWRRQFPAIPGIATPREPCGLPLLDHGEGYDTTGIATQQPPVVLDRMGYTVLVPAVDADGNDLGGVRAPMVAAPLATYCGWNLRAAGHGVGAMHEFTGSTIPLPATREEREATGDPRPAVQERYGDAAGYVRAITAAAEALVAERRLLAEDVPRCAAAADNWHSPRHTISLP